MTPGSDYEMSHLEGSEPKSEEDIVPAEQIKHVKDIDDGSQGVMLRVVMTVSRKHLLSM